MKTYYIRIQDNNILACYLNEDFDDLYKVETEVDLLYEINSYIVDTVDEENKTCIIKEKVLPIDENI